jgi:hypothetical protein
MVIRASSLFSCVVVTQGRPRFRCSLLFKPAGAADLHG